MSTSRRLSSAGPLAGLAVGHAVEVQGSRGIVRFSGTTEFASGKWFGVELEEAQGKNDGSVQGKRYFECPPGHGVFVRSSQVKVLTSSAERAPRATIHGAEIQGIRAPSNVPNADALRAARRATVQPSRIAASPASAIAPPSRIGGVLAQRSQPTAGARRMSGVQTMGASRRSTLTGARSPASPGLRQTSGSESATSRPMSREQLISREQSVSREQTMLQESPASRDQTLSRKQSISRMETPSPVGGKADVAEQEPEEAPQTPTKEIEAAKEAPRTPYRPALSMDEASAFDAGPALAAQTVPLKQHEELRLKFKFLEQKRSEDRQRLQEADKMRSEAEQALRVREKLAAKVSAQQAEVRTLRQQLKDATMARDDAEAKYTETLDAMEMLAVDKEMAEERAEALVQEASVLREQLDEPDVGAGNHMDEQTEEPAQLQRQNARLKEALVRLRDVAAESEATLGQRVKQLEREAAMAAEQAQVAQGLRTQLQAAEAQIEDLKERLDDALGAEELIESLSERNLDLGARVEELQGAVESLEALCEVNNEMEETRAEEEQGLRAELERMSAVASARARRVDALEEAVADGQHTAEQYRELVATLQADVQSLRAREQTQAGEVASAALQAQQALSLNLQLRSTALRTRARAVDLELRRLDTDQATERLAMTEPFLPDHFFRTEAGALAAVLSVRRLAAKADVLCAQLEQDEAAASISDAFVAAADVRAQLSQFSGGAALLAGFLSTCSAADFAHAPALQTDAQGMERRLNGLIDLVRSEEFRAPDALPEVRRLTAQLREMADTHVPQALEATAPQRLANAASRLAFAADEQLANLVFAEQLLAEPETESLVFADADRQALAMRVLPAMASVVQNCKAAKLPALKLLRQADDMLRANVAANDRAFELADDVLQASDELRDYSVRVRSVVQSYFVSASAGDGDGEPIMEPVSLERLQQDLASIAQDVFGATEATPLGLALGVSQRVGRELSALLAFVGDDQNAQAANCAEAPWVARAQQFKASLVQNTDVERRTRELEEEIVSVRRELKLRDQALREGSVKTEMLEKRADTMRRQAEQVGELRKLLDGAHIKEKTYDEALESLQSEMDALEAECRRLRQAEAAAKHAIQAGHAATGAPMPTDLLGLRNKIVALQGSLVYLRRENAHLRAKALSTDELPELHVPMQRSPFVAEAVREARQVAKEACRLAAMPRLVSLASTKACAWQPLASRPQFELYRQQTLAQTLKQRVEGVQERLRAIPRLPMVV
ncbi:hypothetical protein GGH12_004218 [Coemansia sp. RSA 1822]|nr:hypothetical protein LPJ76_003986 [Coemansia sp. RSA 638]KAJ2538507.1 hypothetical protein GGF49_005869 [Coemansia sp. RSA 1853]KAJ2561151.1 hypothetical protein GGH12_004218 [Coemansia sp. RSA 1822]